MRNLVLVFLLPLAGCNPFVAAAPTPTPNQQEAALIQAIRHYYDVFNQVRSTGDASLIDSVTDPEGVDRSNVQAFVAQQRANHRLSVITADDFSKWKIKLTATVAIATFDLTISGYDIDASTRQPIESPTTLPPSHITMELRSHDSRWLVFNRQAVANGP